MTENKDLPKGWTIAKLDDVIVRMTNGANANQYKEKVGLPISRIETISKETIDLNRVKYIKEDDPTFIEKYKLRDGDILFSHINSDSHLGKTALFKIEKFVTLIHGINLLLLRPYKEILPEIINYQIKYLRALGRFSSVAQKAVNQSSINQAKLKSFEILIPPLNEQKRILDKIEELITDLDKGIEYLEIAKQQLRIYRHGVLKWAFEGRFTNNNSIEGLPKGWTEMPIHQFADCLDNKRKPINKVERQKRKGNIPYYGANGITGWIDDFLFDEPLVLVVEDETFVGRELPFSYIVIGKSWVNNHAHILKPKDGNNIDFLNYQLAYYPFLPLTTGTTGRKKLTKNKLINAPIRTCNLAEQEKVVKEIESRLSVCDKIEETIGNSLLLAGALRLSIIKKAFEGKLVPQNPSDEPAEKLLERIRAAKGKPEKKGKVKAEKKVKATKKKALVNG